jgi:serine/threonine protein kinase
MQNKNLPSTPALIAAAQILSVIACLHKHDMVLRRINLDFIYLVEHNNIQDIRFIELFFCSTLDELKKEPDDFFEKIYQ